MVLRKACQVHCLTSKPTAFSEIPPSASLSKQNNEWNSPAHLQRQVVSAEEGMGWWFPNSLWIAELELSSLPFISQGPDSLHSHFATPLQTKLSSKLFVTFWKWTALLAYSEKPKLTAALGLNLIITSSKLSDFCRVDKHHQNISSNWGDTVNTPWQKTINHFNGFKSKPL